MSLGAWEYIIIFLAILLFFGAKRIPDLARSIGQGLQEFRKASEDVKKEIEKGKRDVSDTVSKQDSTKEAEKS